ncbi:MAG TPA: hypothetical protein VNK46_12930 [Nitrospiraceae bacterium]|jgi:hypothetical protein|nr:hypothetical protein [Nitrospiraceae bacterium]
MTGAGRTMTRRSWLSTGLLVFLAVLGVHTSAAIIDHLAAQDAATPRVLPRSFQRARLGMALGEFSRVSPETAKTRRQNLATVTLTEPSSDPAIRRVLYRFHRGKLYEIQIHYRPERLPSGVTGLLARLKEIYGPPSVDREDHLDIDSGDLRRRRTVWQDGRTKITFLEREIIDEHGHRSEPTLTLTDLELERLRDADQNEQARRQVERIPIPLPDGGPGPGRVAAEGRHRSLGN